MAEPVSYIVFKDVPLERLADRLPSKETLDALFLQYALEHPFKAWWFVKKLNFQRRFDALRGKPWNKADA